MRRITFIVCFLLLHSAPMLADSITIRYRIAGVDEVKLNWGVNDWQRPPVIPEGTRKDGKTLRTPLRLQDGYYTTTLDVPEGYIIDFAFVSSRKTGPFGVRAGFWDKNRASGQLYYHHKVKGNAVLSYEAQTRGLEPVGAVSPLHYALGTCLFMLSIGLIWWAWRKYYLREPAGIFNRTAYFFAVSLGMMAGLFYFRLLTAELLFPWLMNPVETTPQLFSASWQDMLFAISLMIVFGLLMLLAPRYRRFTLISYTVMASLALLFAFANIKITEMLGRPFNYQWFYYSDFLKSNDAILAVGGTITAKYLASGFLLLGASVATAWLVYQLYRQRTWPMLVLVLVWLLTAGITAQRYSQTPVQAANPVIYFLQSLQTDRQQKIADQQYKGVSEFYQRQPETLPDSLAARIRAAGIRNVVFFVLESTPAEYITPYNPGIQATPCIDSLMRHAVLFEHIYAHTPATNKSMFSFLCAQYPDLSFRSVTRETPDIDVPSVSGVLKEKGYRTAFFNSGDNRFQNAEGFLKHRGFEILRDFRDNECASSVFSDKRYSKSGLDGVDDSCLSVRFFNWLGTDTSRPFFSMLWSFQTHYPYFTSGQEHDFGTGQPMLEKYLNGLHRADQALGALVRGLEQRGLLNSTLIVVTGDHGEAFGRHNQTTHASHIYEENLHVPFILINPQLFSGERRQTVGGISDAAPTILSLLRQPAPDAWQGQSLFSTSRRNRVYFFSPYGDFQFGFREGHQKFIFNATQNSYELYDLSTDPFESRNLAPAQPGYVQNAAHWLKAWMYYQSAFMDSVFRHYQQTHKP